MLPKSTGDADSDGEPTKLILGMVKSRLDTGGAGGFVTLPIRKGNKALTVEIDE
jgi:hypothetical protein